MRNKLTVTLAILFTISLIAAIRENSEKNRSLREIERFKITEISTEESLREIEVSLWETSNALMYDLVEPGAISSEELDTQIQDINKFLPRYSNLVQSEEKLQAIAEFEKLWSGAVTQAYEMIRLRDQLTARLEASRKAVLEADVIIDFKIRTGMPDSASARTLERSKLLLAAEIEEGLWEVFSAVLSSALDASAVRRREVDKHVKKIGDRLGELEALPLGQREKRHLGELKSSWQALQKKLEESIQLKVDLHTKTLRFWDVIHAADDLIDFRLQTPVAPVNRGQAPE